MKNRNAIVLGIAASAMALSMCACAQDKPNSLKIDDMLVFANGAPVEIETVFGGKKEEIVYEYDEYSLSIADNKVTCYKTGSFAVTATAETCSTTFTVVCKNAATVVDSYAWIGYPASELSAVINVPGETEISYTCDSDILSIDGNKVTALKTGKAEVTATVAGYDTTFFVTCNAVDEKDESKYYIKPDWPWVSKANTRRNNYMLNGHDGKTTLFMGDSFFDPEFFTSFYSFYGDYDAMCMGIGGTTSNQWEMFFNKDGKYTPGTLGQFDGIKPKNIVFQLGNNNIYNDESSAVDTLEDLQRFFTFIHAKMPETKLYYFCVTARIGVMSIYDTIVKNVNSGMIKWAEGKDWIVAMDTSEQMTPDKIKDNIHPKPEAYEVFVNALEKAGLQLEYKI